MNTTIFLIGSYMLTNVYGGFLTTVFFFHYKQTHSEKSLYIQ